MATWTPDNLTTKGALAAFHDRLDSIPTFYDKVCQIVPSNAKVENYGFPGHLPIPRVMRSGRRVQGLRDWSYNVENETYELTIAIDRTYFEDDQTGLVASRMREVAEAWATFKDDLLVDLLINGGTAGYTAFDGNTFFHNTRTLGDSGTIDNKLTSAAATGTIPIAAECKTSLSTSIAQMRGFKDDQGRPFNTQAASKLAVVCPPECEFAYKEAINSSVILQPNVDMASATAGAAVDNVFYQIADVYVTGYYSNGTYPRDYIMAIGAERKPFIYQERTPLEVQILDDAASVAYHDAVLVLCRQRFVLAYGEFRRCIEYIWS